MAAKAGGKHEYMILNIGSGVQVGSSVALLGVAESLEAAKKFIRDMGTANAGKIAIVRTETVIARTPVVDLIESDESVLAKPKP